MSAPPDPRDIAAFADCVDLASEALGGEALLASDDFFAGVDNLVKDGRAVWDADRYTDRGKWMDGWESRRRRVPGHDRAIVRLGVRGRLLGVDVDTDHFLGNHPPFATLEACRAPADWSPARLRDEAEWTTVLAQVPLQRGSRNLFALSGDAVYSHVRLHMHPAGGIARLRVYGRPAPHLAEGEEVDLAGLMQGGRALACSDMFFSPMNNLLLPFPAKNMGGGWETRRSRPPGADWVIIELGAPGRLREAVIDTAFFKGNFPETAALDAVHWPGAPPQELIREVEWTELLPEQRLRADSVHRFALPEAGPFTHVRLRIRPDGGVSRLRVLGSVDHRPPDPADPLLGRLNDAGEAEAREALSRCCGSRRWVDRMMAARPFASRTHLFGVARTAWWMLDEGDWLEAFSHHPRIGADRSALREKYAATAAWSAGEQAGAAGADEQTLLELARGNTAYEARYGFLFLVCATGKTAAEMSALLQGRLHHERDQELFVAAGEHVKITRLRLEKLAAEESP